MPTVRHAELDLQDDDDDPIICATCNGSGEGMHDGSRCSSCHGSGHESTARDGDDDRDDWPDDEDRTAEFEGGYWPHGA